MRLIYLLLATVSLTAWLGSASPINPKHILINRPTEQYLFRVKRTPQHQYPVKGYKTPAIEYQPHQPSNRPSALEMRVTKGEYVCGNRICKLQPGQIPKGCNGICQYPV